MTTQDHRRTGSPSEDRQSYAFPSIFNDAIGPVMRGPSSSHSAAAVRIGRLARDLMDGVLDQVLVEYDTGGSLATTHQSQGSDMGLFAGLLGWDPDDERLPESARVIEEAGIRVRIDISDYGAPHSSTYKLTLTNPSEQHELVAISTGGGMIEVIAIDGISVSIAGDYYESIICLDSPAHEVAAYLSETVDADDVRVHTAPGTQFVQVKGQALLQDEIVSNLRSRYGVHSIKRLHPVLPVLSRRGLEVPFLTCSEMQRYNRGRELALWELAVHYERARGKLSDDDIVARMEKLVEIMQASVRHGLAGTNYPDRILEVQSGSFRAHMEEGRLLDAGLLNRMVLYVTALMEAKSAMGLIVAAPTAGSCGALPGACLAAAEVLGRSQEETARAMLAAGLIGVFIAAGATFSAELGGCQAECGAGSGMAAAALVTLAQGTTGQAVAAASMALQNTLGMICDPVANRVEVPCLGNNVMAAANALACANMALAGFDEVIPLDQVIETMDRVGRSIPRELRCTALGGLSITKTSKEIERALG